MMSQVAVSVTPGVGTAMVVARVFVGGGRGVLDTPVVVDGLVVGVYALEMVDAVGGNYSQHCCIEFGTGMVAVVLLRIDFALDFERVSSYGGQNQVSDSASLVFDSEEVAGGAAEEGAIFPEEEMLYDIAVVRTV